MAITLMLGAGARAQEAEPSPQGLPASASPPPTKGHEEIDAATRAVLAQYGTFRATPAYSEVWVPSVVPQDWRPYAACHWVNSRTLGWYYADRTPWGAIIHHYGRWTHDAALGWVWVPGTAFSPGWVAWRTSPDYIGWAPLPPNGDLKAAAAFDVEAFWTFMETPVFDRGCGGGANLAPTRTLALLGATQPVTEIAFARGLWVVVLPAYVTGPIVDIAVDFKPWPGNLFAAILSKWNVAWNSVDVKTTINVIDCRKTPPLRTAGGAPPPARLPPPRQNACPRGYPQPDGRCGQPVVYDPRPPYAPPGYSPPGYPPPGYVPPPDRRLCADGRGPDAAGRCPPPSTTTAARPAEPPAVVVLPLPVPRVPIVPVPVIQGGGAPACRPDQIRQSDGRCRHIEPLPTNLPATGGPGGIDPCYRDPGRCRQPGRDAGPTPRPPPPTIATVPPPTKAATTAESCGRLEGVERRRCLDGQRGQEPKTAQRNPDGGFKAATVEVHGDGGAAARPRPPALSPAIAVPRFPPASARPSTPPASARPSAPPALARPVARRPSIVVAQRPRPVVFRPHAVRPVRIVAQRPRRPEVRRPVFHPPRARAVSRPSFRPARPQFRPAPHVGAPRGGGRRR